MPAQAPVIWQWARAELSLGQAGAASLAIQLGMPVPAPGTFNVPSAARTPSTVTGMLLKPEGPISLLCYAQASIDHATIPIMLNFEGPRILVLVAGVLSAALAW